MTFDLKSGTKVTIDENRIAIERTVGKSAVKGLFAGRIIGQMTIKTSAITGLIFNADYLRWGSVPQSAKVLTQRGTDSFS
jgi:hypothetical protein